MTNFNPILSADFYKVGHVFQYPANTTEVYSNLTARSNKHAPSIEGVKINKVLFAGLQAYLKGFLVDSFNDHFFSVPKEKVIAEYNRRNNIALGEGSVSTDHIAALHDLGYLPLRIKALPEGSLVPMGIPLLTVVNTLPEFAWLTNYIETSLSAEIWKIITTATIAFEYRNILESFAAKTGSPKDFVLWQGHDFSMRGMSGVHDAGMTGMGHLFSFLGTDTIPAIEAMEKFYSGLNTFVGGSVPATEHSVMCAGGETDEKETIRRLIQDVYPSGVVSVVSDTWDFFNVITNTARELKDVILGRKQNAIGLCKVVFRPDCYAEGTKILTPGGWLDFKDVTEDTLVAQVKDDGSYEFVTPSKITNTYYEGDMIRFFDHYGKVDFLVTPNHRMITKIDGKERIDLAENLKVGNHVRTFERSAVAEEKGQKLTNLERLKIAFQADGSYCTGTSHKIRFSFSKQRKIDRLISLAKEMELPFVVYDLKDSRKEICITIEETEVSKNFEWVDISNLSKQWCIDFVEELSHWDSCRRSNTRFKFDSTNKSVMDIVELVAISAGYGVLVSEYEDNRKEIFSNLYTCHIMKNPTIGGQAISKQVQNYKGNVYCATVPSGRLLVKNNRATLVCGNSGNPADILCGNPRAEIGSPEYKGAVECLWETFGGTTTSTGHKLLDSHVGLIYGDSITLNLANEILTRLADKGFASANVVMGIGSYTYQYLTRDTFGMAMKATSAVVDGTRRALFKNPKTDDGTKKSAKGLLRVDRDETNDGNYILANDVTPFEEANGELKEVFFNGKLVNEVTLEQIRARVNSQVKK